MDYGCGTGATVPLLLDRFDVEWLVGLDSSMKSIEMAKDDYSSDRVTFQHTQQYRSHAEMDLVYCNGVFHHIPIARRAMVARSIWTSLQPGGYFAFWENNPWNPGTRYVMSRIEFDRDAITLTAGQARRLLRSVGFDIVRMD